MYEHFLVRGGDKILLDTGTEHSLAVCVQEAPPSHDILVFMTGQEEIEALARTCRDIAKHLPDSCGPMVVIPLYASLPPAQQLRVFQPAPKVKAMICTQDKQICPAKEHVCYKNSHIGSLHCCCQLFVCFKIVSILYLSRVAGRLSSQQTLLRHQSLSLGSNSS